jgi:hypothetical protein
VVSNVEVIPELAPGQAPVRRTVVVACAADEVAISGGFEVTEGGNDITITHNRPDQTNPRNWIVVARQIDEDRSAFRAYAVCATTAGTGV